MLFKEKSTIVLQGDSITDACRGYEPDGIGFGYARMIIKGLEALYPDYELNVINRGISGNRVVDLEARWDEDCINHKPDLVSIMIGVNDTWHSHGVGLFGGVDAEQFEKSYRNIIERTLESGAKIILFEPYAFHHDAFKEEWRDDFGPKIQIVRRLAEEYKVDALIPLDGLMYKWAAKYGAKALSEDGVHPTPLGHRLIALEWLKSAGALEE